MKFSILVLLSLTLASSANAAGRFTCKDMQDLGSYNFHVSGNYDSRGNLRNVEFGTFPRYADGADEQAETLTLGSLRPDKDLRLTTPEWRMAYAYDVTTEEYGVATLYLQSRDMANKAVGIARLKYSARSGKMNLLLRCYYQ